MHLIFLAFDHSYIVVVFGEIIFHPFYLLISLLKCLFLIKKNYLNYMFITLNILIIELIS